MRKHKQLRFREGDFLETKDGLFFDVKGLIHPHNRVIAFVRYVPSPKGGRERGGRKYAKIYELSKRYDFLKKRYPEYLVYDHVFDEYLNEVPLARIAHHYQPQQKTQQLLCKRAIDLVESQTQEFIKCLVDSSPISLDNVGVSGSVLVGLHTKTSDIDLIVYGRRSCFTLHKTMSQLLHRQSILKPYDTAALKRRYRSRQRDTKVSFEDFLFHESRKSFQGFFKGRDFFIRYIKDWTEIEEKYGDVMFQKEGYVRVRGKIADDSEALFTPCTYLLDNVKVIRGKAVSPITKVVSFRGRFCEQVQKDEWFIAQGKLEKALSKGREHFRIVLGNDPQDYMIRLHEEG